MEKSLDTIKKDKGNQSIQWTEINNQTYPFYNKQTKTWGKYNSEIEYLTQEDRYDKNVTQLHIKTTTEQAGSINGPLPALSISGVLDQWQYKDKSYVTSNDFRVKTAKSPVPVFQYDPNAKQKWIKSSANMIVIIVKPILSLDYLTAIAQSKSSKGLSISETSDTYKVVADSTFYQAQPKFYNSVEKNSIISIDSDAVTYAIANGNGKNSDYQNQKLKHVKSVDVTAVIDKKTNLFREIKIQLQMELEIPGGKPVTSDYVIDMHRVKSLQPPIHIPQTALNAK